MLRSAVGMAHVLRSGLVVGYTTSYFQLIMLGYHSDPNRSYVRNTVSRCLIFPALPTGLHGLCFGCCFSGPLPLRSLMNSPPIGVRFRESLVVRLYSEIDHIHLSSETQCVSHHLPQVDCHII